LPYILDYQNCWARLYIEIQSIDVKVTVSLPIQKTLESELVRVVIKEVSFEKMKTKAKKKSSSKKKKPQLLNIHINIVLEEIIVNYMKFVYHYTL
jgi:hypothetical protein